MTYYESYHETLSVYMYVSKYESDITFLIEDHLLSFLPHTLRHRHVIVVTASFFLYLAS